MVSTAFSFFINMELVIKVICPFWHMLVKTENKNFKKDLKFLEVNHKRDSYNFYRLQTLLLLLACLCYVFSVKL